MVKHNHICKQNLYQRLLSNPTFSCEETGSELLNILLRLEKQASDINGIWHFKYMTFWGFFLVIIITFVFI